jgi:hypothetical protein
MTTKYRIYDTFNHRPISNQCSLKAAVIAEDKFGRAIRRNPKNNYINIIIEYTDEEGEWLKLPTDEVQDAQQQHLDIQNAQQQYCNN